jgi:hypothetical protein
VLFLTSPVQRKFLQMLVICMITIFGSGKMLNQNFTFPYKTDLRSSSLPAK